MVTVRLTAYHHYSVPASSRIRRSVEVLQMYPAPALLRNHIRILLDRFLHSDGGDSLIEGVQVS